MGRETQVLFEEERNGAWYGHTPNYLLVQAEGRDLHNCLRRVRITEWKGEVLAGTCIPEENQVD